MEGGPLSNPGDNEVQYFIIALLLWYKSPLAPVCCLTLSLKHNTTKTVTGNMFVPKEHWKVKLQLMRLSNYKCAFFAPSEVAHSYPILLWVRESIFLLCCQKSPKSYLSSICFSWNTSKCVSVLLGGLCKHNPPWLQDVFQLCLLVMISQYLYWYSHNLACYMLQHLAIPHSIRPEKDISIV